MKKINLIVAAIAALTLSFGTIRAVEKGHEGHNHAEGEHGAKTVLVIKDVAKIVVVHNVEDGIVTLTILDSKDKALKPAQAPRLNLIVEGKRKQVKTMATEKVAAGNVFTAEDAVLKAKKLTGEITLQIGDNRHNINLDPHFGHNHGPGVVH